MNYQEVRSKIEELIRNGWLFSDVRLDSATVISDGEKFVKSHIGYLDFMKEMESKGKKIRRALVEPSIHRLIKYYEKVLEIKNSEK